MPNPYLTRTAKAGKSAHGKASERRLAKSLGARLTPASGALDGAKGDMKVGEFLLEAKSTINDSLKLDRDFLLKISHEALYAGKNPALAVSFVNGDGSPKHDGEWVMITKNLFSQLLENT